MPFVFAFLGVAMLAIGMRGHASEASQLLASEFTGANSFVQWFLAIMILGLVGYYKPARPVTDALIGLVILAMVIARGNPNQAGGGFFAQLEDAFKNTPPTPAKKVTPTTAQGIGGGALAVPGTGNLSPLGDGTGNFPGVLAGGGASFGSEVGKWIFNFYNPSATGSFGGP